MQFPFLPNKILILVLVVLNYSLCKAQERTTKGTKIILAVNEKSGSVDDIELLTRFQNFKEEKLAEKYSNHKFFLGELKGTYLLTKNGVLLGDDTTIIMFTDKQFSPPEKNFLRNHLAPGDELHIGGVKAKVIANTKGELIIKTKK